ncbi:unnamed protein product [Gordionus sp. m RMFG-2023]
MVKISSCLTSTQDKNKCLMTHMFGRPIFKEILLPYLNQYPYKLYNYFEEHLPYKKIKFKGTPVLFFPGNSGSYKQVRSIASILLDKMDLGLIHKYEIYTIDFKEEKNAFSGYILNRQTTTPHKESVLWWDTGINSYYHKINSFWIKKNMTKTIPFIVSISGGPRDELVPNYYCYLEPALLMNHENQPILHYSTDTIPRIWLSNDHLSIAWCNQLIKLLTRYIERVNTINDGNLITQEEHLNIIQSYFQGAFQIPITFQNSLDNKSDNDMWNVLELKKSELPLQLSDSQLLNIFSVSSNINLILIPLGYSDTSLIKLSRKLIILLSVESLKQQENNIFLLRQQNFTGFVDLLKNGHVGTPNLVIQRIPRMPHNKHIANYILELDWSNENHHQEMSQLLATNLVMLINFSLPFPSNHFLINDLYIDTLESTVTNSNKVDLESKKRVLIFYFPNLNEVWKAYTVGINIYLVPSTENSFSGLNGWAENTNVSVTIRFSVNNPRDIEHDRFWTFYLKKPPLKTSSKKETPSKLLMSRNIQLFLQSSLLAPNSLPCLTLILSTSSFLRNCTLRYRITTRVIWLHSLKSIFLHQSYQLYQRGLSFAIVLSLIACRPTKSFNNSNSRYFIKMMTFALISHYSSYMTSILSIRFLNFLSIPGYDIFLPRLSLANHLLLLVISQVATLSLYLLIFWVLSSILYIRNRIVFSKFLSAQAQLPPNFFLRTIYARFAFYALLYFVANFFSAFITYIILLSASLSLLTTDKSRKSLLPSVSSYVTLSLLGLIPYDVSTIYNLYLSLLGYHPFQPLKELATPACGMGESGSASLIPIAGLKEKEAAIIETIIGERRESARPKWVKFKKPWMAFFNRFSNGKPNLKKKTKVAEQEKDYIKGHTDIDDTILSGCVSPGGCKKAYYKYLIKSNNYIIM